MDLVLALDTNGRFQSELSRKQVKKTVSKKGPHTMRA